LITAKELFDNISAILDNYEEGGEHEAYIELRRILVLVCHEAVKDTPSAFGNLFAQVAYVCKKSRMKLSDRIDVQTMRYNSNKQERQTAQQLPYDIRALAMLISAVFNVPIPSSVATRIPHRPRQFKKAVHTEYPYIRGIVDKIGEKTITLKCEKPTNGETIEADYTDFEYLKEILQPGMQVNILDSSVETEESEAEDENQADVDETEKKSGQKRKRARTILHPALFIVEPDYLLDISSIAGCFKEYGHHPLSYLVGRMSPKANSQAILLGNFASAALDDIINLGDKFSLGDTIKKNFRKNVFDFTACKDFDPAKFKTDAQNQAANLKQFGQMLRDKYGSQHLLLEPTFVCEKLGLQGRVDLMSDNCRILVEQKSGRNMNIERNMPDYRGNYQLENHFVQLLLYYGVLRYNFNLGMEEIDTRLLYSKYPMKQGVVIVTFYRELFREAIALRNKIVAEEYRIAADGFDKIIDEITPETLNTKKLENFFYNRYLLPPLQRVCDPLHSLSSLEKAYFTRMITFMFQENKISKTGGEDGIRGAVSDLWLMPLSSKIESGNIYAGLTIRGYDHYGITFDIADQGDDFLPNFRIGDSVYLYAYRPGQEPDLTASILYKGMMVDISSRTITVSLLDTLPELFCRRYSGGWSKDAAQKSEENDAAEITEEKTTDSSNSEQLAVPPFNSQPIGNLITSERSEALFAVEHTSGEIGVAANIAGLHEFITAPLPRRKLLLGEREPETDESYELSRSYAEAYDPVVLRAMRAKDCFLLQGPPGTGKTSRALRYIVEEELTRPDSRLLLMAYTNRAVDEISDMLDEAGLPFLRVGNQFSAAPRFHKYLVSEQFRDTPKLSMIQASLQTTRIIVATTATMMSKTFIFDVLHFSLAIVDEASQILEPSIMGILVAHRGTGKCAIDRFILIGDHKQLPAVVQQPPKMSAVNDPLLQNIGLTDCRNSLFERLFKTFDLGPHCAILRRQGRMHPDVAEFANKMFYAREQLLPVPCEHQLETSLGYDLPAADALDEKLKACRMIYIPSPLNVRTDLSVKVNEAEAKITADLLRRIYRFRERDFDPDRTVGVIVPYRNQIAMIRREVEALGIDLLRRISIDTVERYQGSQRDIIIYSFTIQKAYQLEFLTASCFEEEGKVIDRKLNVALTRARKQMIITGNREVMLHDPIFRELITFCEKKP